MSLTSYTVHDRLARATPNGFRHEEDMPITRKNIERFNKSRAISKLPPATAKQIVHAFISVPTPRHVKAVERLLATTPAVLAKAE